MLNSTNFLFNQVVIDRDFDKAIDLLLKFPISAVNDTVKYDRNTVAVKSSIYRYLRSQTVENDSHFSLPLRL